MPSKGHLCLFVPAHRELHAPIDDDFGHCRRYTKRELKRTLGNAGFAIVRLNYFNCVGYFAWWLNFCVLKKRRFDIGAVRLFDRAIFAVRLLVRITRLLATVWPKPDCDSPGKVK